LRNEQGRSELQEQEMYYNKKKIPAVRRTQQDVLRKGYYIIFTVLSNRKEEARVAAAKNK